MELKFILEALLFSAQKALSPSELRETLASAAAEDGESLPSFRRTGESEIVSALEELAAHHEGTGRSYRLVCVAGAWQFVTKPEYAPWLRALVGQKQRAPRLSQPALETLAIIAYRQPLTRSEIEQVRGVSVDGVMQTLLERGLIEATGRAEVVGRPMNYGTTPLFLEYFGLRCLDDLPAADELRKLPVERPAGLPTTEPGLATVPPADLSAPSTAAETPEPDKAEADGSASSTVAGPATS
jgi:segregation and condensation protein B